MACDNHKKVYLGYEDEYVSEKHRHLVNFTTNKIGGHPNWHTSNTLSIPRCNSCSLPQLLALQLYAPLDYSDYHRTLYIFVCINSNCWNQNESWTCLRIQSAENTCQTDLAENSTVNIPSTTSWLSGQDDWGDTCDDNSSEQNGNNFQANNLRDLNLCMQTDSDETLKDEFASLQVDDPNANSRASAESPVGGGAVGRLDSPQAFAEIDGEEREVVCIDTPTQPKCDLVTLLHEVTPFPVEIEPDAEIKFSFLEIFISVDEEDVNTEVSQHIRDLLVEYKHRNADLTTPAFPNTKTTEMDCEKYEKSVPKHGDEMFHNFISRIQKNPGQLLRYSRDNSAALFLYPLSGYIGKCKYCSGELVFEVQVLPTMIPKLILCPEKEQNYQVEFGTVLIYTCTRSCWSSSDLYREEHIIVQAEKL